MLRQHARADEFRREGALAVGIFGGVEVEDGAEFGFGGAVGAGPEEGGEVAVGDFEDGVVVGERGARVRGLVVVHRGFSGGDDAAEEGGELGAGEGGDEDVFGVALGFGGGCGGFVEHG